MSSNIAGGGSDFHLPDEILSVIPTDPYDQLDLARKITSMAIASRVSTLESETGRLRQNIVEKDRLISGLQDKLGEMDEMFRDMDARLRATVDKNVKLLSERDALTATVKKLNRDLAKLETFKRQLMQSLNDDNALQAETVDIGTCDQSVKQSSLVKDEASNDTVGTNYVGGSTENREIEASRYMGQRFSITPYITPRLTPTGTPKVTSTGGSPGGYSAAVSQKNASGMTSPTKSHFEGRGMLSSWYPPSALSSAPSSPPRGRPLPGLCACKHELLVLRERNSSAMPEAVSHISSLALS
ncbi:uncharacterized protein At4g15545-like isoform X2 [Aristolochia californica]|uniref:uncharacterized protein At4g15545-like isoform X2 n=1 Tax=Aristolochia californica TaxID=171875 RepID=UPI0035E01DA6